ncbi:hypothetical protein [Tenacibaculum sp. M341]|uniref:hypothetical protein n=1 Tax=Tenacibaculum sp. M341 TaxID=2530339 RepID=UPI001050D4E7|nr:hypothetical protein [Tenacibaculum sp. M341]TCI93742.1 hypothetical protein EYW44_04815 [Tenacibaculum sp. M341]
MFKKVLICIICAVFISCHSDFDKDRWLVNVDGEYTCRDEMLDNLINDYHLKGKTYGEVLTLLGNPDNHCNYNNYELGYVITKVHTNTDTVKTKSLVLYLDKPQEEVNLSSKVIDVKVIYW